MSRLLSGLMACSLILGFSADADAQRQTQRPTDAPAARCTECGARTQQVQRFERRAPRRSVRREFTFTRERVNAPFAATQREEARQGRGRRGDAKGGEGRGRRGDAKGGEGRGRRGDAKGGEGRGRRGDARGGEGRGRRGDARGGEGRRGNSERARKQREKLRKQADTNGDGVVDQAEREAVRKKIQERRKRGGKVGDGERRPV